MTKPLSFATPAEPKTDGRWKAAYDSCAITDVPNELLTALKRNKKANAFYRTLDRANLYAIAIRKKA